MTQHLSASVENGPDLGTKNLPRLFQLFNGTSPPPPFPFYHFILWLLEAVDAWRLVIIVSEMMYHALNDVLSLMVTDGRSASVTFSLTAYCRSAASYFKFGTMILTTVPNLAYPRSALHLMFWSSSRQVQRMLQFFHYFLSSAWDTWWGTDSWQSGVLFLQRSKLRGLGFLVRLTHVEWVTRSCDM